MVELLFKSLAGVLILVAIIITSVIAIGVSGLGTARFEEAARAALTELAGEDIAADFGDVRLTWSGPGLVGLELRDAVFMTKADGFVHASAKQMQFGIKLMPLFSGDIDLSGVKLAGLKVTMGRARDGQTVRSPFLNERGLIDPDKLAARIFSSLDLALSSTSGVGGQVQIVDASLEFAAIGSLPPMLVRTMEISRQQGGLSLRAESLIGETTLLLSGEITNPGGKAGAVAFALMSEINAFRWDYTPGTLKKPFARSIDADLALRLTGSRPDKDSAGTIKSLFNIDNFVLETLKDERQQSKLSLEATLAEGTGKIEIDELYAEIGRTRLEAHGAIQPAPAGVSEKPVYRYELVSDGSRVAAADSPQRAVGIFARMAGFIDPPEGRITADELHVRTNGGEVLGNAAIVFPGGKTPAIFLAVTVPKMPVPHAKQLWPWKAADGARSWVLNNVFGGEVRDSLLEVSLVAGRLGDGVRLRPDEIFGHFEVFGTRFDTAGDIPPVRDADGTIDFQGTDVQIRLSSGTAYMRSGRTVDAANGVFKIDAAKRPLVGQLEIDVAGQADAVAELATYEPIRADKFIDLVPDDFSGSVGGQVTGNIPLQRLVDRSTLDWRVALDFEDLGVAKPFDGQILTSATGSIVIDPASAVIKAKGLLNDIPAEIALDEPFGESTVRRSRDLTLTLDDKARAKLVPALNTILSGPVTVELVEVEGETRQISADLTRARLQFPWVGWSKGRGIPAKASFVLEEDGALTTLSNFKLSGNTFQMSGVVTLKGGEIETAEFKDARLNRGDSFDLSVRRSGANGYRLAVSAKQIDARALIRQFLGDQEDDGKGLDKTPVTLVAKAKKVVGFGNEAVLDVEIDYSGTGTRVSNVNILATTASGKKFSVTQTSDTGEKTVAMQSADAGAILRFLDIYGNMQGGSIDLQMASKGNAPLRGKIDARDFWVVNEPRLKTLVASSPQDDGRSLNQAIKRDIDVSKANFERGFAGIEKGDDYLLITDGVLRGPLIGSTFQGRLYDERGRISMTGTFMPAYGLNRLFADIPLVGLILGNGRDRGLIGITYKLSGEAKSPRLQVNPISVIAPGVFRQIFEFR